MLPQATILVPLASRTLGTAFLFDIELSLPSCARKRWDTQLYRLCVSSNNVAEQPRSPAPATRIRLLTPDSCTKSQPWSSINEMTYLDVMLVLSIFGIMDLGGRQPDTEQ